MDNVAALLFILLIIFLLIQVPIAVALGLSTMVAVLVGGSYTLTYVAQAMIGAANSFPLLAIPFFILAGDLMGQGGISDRLLAVADVFLGRKYGGTAIVTVAVCMFFAAVSGSGPATVAAIGGITIPAMLRQKYDSGFASAIPAIAGSIGCVIPPSIPMVVYCVATGASVSDLFLAGFIPGILIGVVLMIYSYFYCRVQLARGWQSGVGGQMGPHHAHHHPGRHLRRHLYPHRGGRRGCGLRLHHRRVRPPDHRPEDPEEHLRQLHHHHRHYHVRYLRRHRLRQGADH